MLLSAGDDDVHLLAAGHLEDLSLGTANLDHVAAGEPCLPDLLLPVLEVQAGLLGQLGHQFLVEAGEEAPEDLLAVDDEEKDDLPQPRPLQRIEPLDAAEGELFELRGEQDLPDRLHEVPRAVAFTGRRGT